MCKKFSNTVQMLIRARSGLIWARTNEEKRAEGHLIGAAAALKFRSVFIWKSSTGLLEVGKDTKPRTDLATLCKNPAFGPLDQQADGILEYLIDFKRGGPIMVIMEDLSGHIAENSPNRLQAARLLKDLAKQARSSKPQDWVQVVVVDKEAAPQEFIEVELALPNREELRRTVTGMVESIPGEAGDRIQKAIEAEGKMDQVLDALVGLEDQQAQQALAVSLAEVGTVEPEVLLKSKRALLKSEALEWIEPLLSGMDDIGGLDLLKDYLIIAHSSFVLSQRETKTPRPRGALFAGPPGVGKSLTAKCVGIAWKLPVIRLNIGALFGKFQGQSESNWRQARQVVEALAPCILWIDEIEKGLQGFGGGASETDGGTTARVGNDFLTWLAEVDKPIYIIGTANDPLKVPAEFFRAGRFDTKFWIDVPNTADRVKVLSVISKKWRSVAADKLVSELELDFGQVAKQLAGYTPAEVEQAVTDALMLANYEDRALTEEDVVNASKLIRPVLEGWQGDGTLERVRQWGAKQRKANDPNDPEASNIDVDDYRQVFVPTDAN